MNGVGRKLLQRALRDQLMRITPVASPPQAL
jgi:hypothetical protein